MSFKTLLVIAGIAGTATLGTPAAAVAHESGGATAAPPCGGHYGWHAGPMTGQDEMAPGRMPMMGHGMMGHGMMGHGMMGHGMMDHGMMGPGMMGPGMMDHGMMGPGMMGPGMMGPGMMGPGMMDHGMMDHGMMGSGMMGQAPGSGTMQPLRRDLSAAEVTHMLEHRLAWAGNPNVKVGRVEETDEDTIVAEIVTQDGSLVRRLEVDRHSGRMRPAQ